MRVACRFEDDFNPASPCFPFTLQAKMCWFKDKQAEWEDSYQLQFILDTIDSRYCAVILLALAIYLEVLLKSEAGAPNSFISGDTDNVNTWKKFVYAI
jgi:hypothetical protein